MTRLLLSIGIVVVVFEVLVLAPVYAQGPDAYLNTFDPIGPVPDWPTPAHLVPLLGLTGSLFGLWRMWVVMRELRDAR